MQDHPNFVRLSVPGRVLPLEQLSSATPALLQQANLVIPTAADGNNPAQSQPVLVEAFTILPEDTEETWAQINFEDQTARLVHLDVHGTLCQKPLGESVD